MTKNKNINSSKSDTCVIWLTGLSGAGKSTISRELDIQLRLLDIPSYVLDGDILRNGLCKDLKFSQSDRHENVRRVSEVAAILSNAGVLVICALISPFEDDRKMAMSIIGQKRYVEVFVDTPTHVCEQRDPKGLWRKARNGEIKDFTGIDSPYQRPDQPHIHLHTERFSALECANQVISHVKDRFPSLIP